MQVVISVRVGGTELNLQLNHRTALNMNQHLKGKMTMNLVVLWGGAEE